MKTTQHISIRRSKERGHADHGWLQSYHTFSFADYYDPQFMNFRSLRVINDDTVAPGKGFGMHPHRDMEIITYVTEGELEHKDSMGNGSVIKAGDFQRMSAGSGVTHSEFNPSPKNRTKLLQIWILPKTRGLTPSYQELSARTIGKKGLISIGANKKEKGLLTIHQDAQLYLGRPAAKETIEYTIAPHHGVWLHLVRGKINVNGQALQSGDAAAIEEENKLTITASEASEFLLFDLA